MESPVREPSVSSIWFSFPLKGAGTLLALVFVLLFAGCKVEGELWVERSGEGRGSFTVSQMPLTKPELEVELAKRGFIVDKVEEKGPEVLEAWVHWERFANPGPFESFKKLPDGKLQLSFGQAPDFGALTVHVDGKVLETTGYLKKDDTVIFEGGKQALITFRPSSRILPVLVGLLLGLGALVLFVRSWIRKEKPV